MTTVEFLRAARTFLSDPARWYKGDWGDGCDARCLVGALYDGADGEYDTFLASSEVVKRIVGRVPAEFNDDPGTKHADVVAALDRAIAVEEAKAAEFTAEPAEPTLV